MPKHTLRMVMVELRSIRSPDLFVAESIQRCIDLIESDLNPAPAQRHSVTSRAAANRVQFSRLERTVLSLIREKSGGLTDEEGQALLGMGGSTYRPRRVTLANRGYVYDTGEQRVTASGRKATVWALTAAGIAALEKNHAG